MPSKTPRPVKPTFPGGRLYFRPRSGESTGDLGKRMREGVLALIAEQRAEEEEGAVEARSE